MAYVKMNSYHGDFHITFVLKENSFQEHLIQPTEIVWMHLNPKSGKCYC